MNFEGPVKKSGDKKGGITRRDFLKLTAAAGGAVVAGETIWQVKKALEKNPKKKTIEKFPASETNKTRSYPMRELVGAKFGGLLAEYTGIQGTVPETAQINFCENLKKMWQKKEGRSKRNKVVREMSKDILETYCSGETHHMTPEDYAEILDDIIRQARKDLDWKKVAQIERLNEEKIELVRDIAESLDGRDFLAYSLTELMPTTDGKFNLRVFDFLIRNGGREYVESIPAMYDAYTSFGPYQFTSLAWYDVGRERRGGSKLNIALDKPIPHGSVGQLRGDEHHVAAFLFALDNIATLVRILNKKQFTALQRVYKSKHEEIVQYIATAHNYPYGRFGAQGAALRWLSNDAKTPYITSCSWRPRGYAKKTKANLSSLH